MDMSIWDDLKQKAVHNKGPTRSQVLSFAFTLRAISKSQDLPPPCLLSNTPALRLALPLRYFKNLGLPAIAVR